MDAGDVASLLLVLGFLCVDSGGTIVSVVGDGLQPPPIVFPFGGTFKLVVGFAVPVELPGRTLVYGQNFQFQYPLPQNATFFTDFFKDSSRGRREARVKDREAVYEYLEREYQRFGEHETDCLKRSICEASRDPLEDEGLVGELLHLLLTPDYGGETRVSVDYMRAARSGRTGDDCRILYPSCTPGRGILDRISTLIIRRN